MSSSEEDSKIDLLDSPTAVKQKLKKAFCEPGNIENNGVLSFTKHVIFPLLQNNEKFVIPRKEANGGDIAFDSYQQVEEKFANLELHPADLKAGVEAYINRLLEPIRKTFESPELKILAEQAYPVMKKEDSDDVKPHRLDIRVGRIVDISKHPNADSLYVSKIDLGEDKPRTVVSGLVSFYEAENLLNRNVVVLCNLKSSKMRGVESEGMVLCASLDDPKTVEVLIPPETSVPGEKLLFENYEDGTPDLVLNPKKKIWEKLQVDFKTNGDCMAQWKNSYLVSKSGGIVRSTSMADTHIK